MCTVCMFFFCYGTTQLLQSPIMPAPNRGAVTRPIASFSSMCDPCLLPTSSSSSAAHLQQVHATVARRPAGVRRRHLHCCPAQLPRRRQGALVLPVRQRQPPPPFVLALPQGRAARRRRRHSENLQMHSLHCTQGALQIEVHLCKPGARSQVL
jgi:hypothetical protein